MQSYYCVTGVLQTKSTMFSLRSQNGMIILKYYYLYLLYYILMKRFCLCPSFMPPPPPPPHVTDTVPSAISVSSRRFYGRSGPGRGRWSAHATDCGTSGNRHGSLQLIQCHTTQRRRAFRGVR